jgi:hypothetical protein
LSCAECSEARYFMVMKTNPYVFLFVGITGLLAPRLGRDRGTVSEKAMKIPI